MGRHLVTIVGEDRTGIVAAVSRALYEGGCNLGQASMIRLGGSFTIMMVVGHDSADEAAIEAMLAQAARSMGLAVHLAPLRDSPGPSPQPDARIRVFGADRPGIVAEATTALAAAGFNILHLESDVGGTPEKPIYVMTIEGSADDGLDRLHAALVQVRAGGVEVAFEQVETVVG